MKTGVRDVDKGYRKLLNEVFALKRPKIEVGIFASDGAAAYGGGQTVLDVATINEFGAKHIPARSFIGAWFDENQDIAKAALSRLLRRVVKGELSKKAALDQFGLWVVGKIQQRIAAGIDPPNAESTLVKKGSSKPLIDTGLLRGSITFAVNGKQSVSKSAAKRAKQAKKARVAARAKRIREFKRQAKKFVRRQFGVAKKIFKGGKKSATKLARQAKKSLAAKTRKSGRGGRGKRS